MSVYQSPLGMGVSKNPIIDSPYVASLDLGGSLVIEDGITTEDGVYITTEDGINIATE